MSSELQHLAAVIAALNTPSAALGANAHTLGDLKAMGTRPSAYTEVVACERVGTNARLGGRSDIELWRVITRAVGSREDGAREMRHRAKARLLDQSLVVDGIETTPIDRLSSANPIGEDGAYYSGTEEWGYAL